MIKFIFLLIVKRQIVFISEYFIHIYIIRFIRFKVNNAYILHIFEF